jgi:hypothetical protein
MIRLIFMMVVLGTPVNIQEQPMWTTYRKQVDKELLKWSTVYGKSEFLKSAGSREFYRIRNQNGESLGTLVLASAQGRYEKFDLMVALNPTGAISLIKILKYRSEFGSEITNKGWLSQFYIDPAKKFELHKNIDAISGATYSSHGLIDEINAILLLEEFR